MAPNDYYQILDVDQKASSKQIKAAYRKLAFKYHPDRNSKKGSMKPTRFCRIQPNVVNMTP
jgi:DnaJ-class molecular chaperone